MCEGKRGGGASEQCHFSRYILLHYLMGGFDGAKTWCFVEGGRLVASCPGKQAVLIELNDHIKMDISKVCPQLAT